MVRATLRWFKYILTFDDWLDYIRQEGGAPHGPEDRAHDPRAAHPLVFLWPRLLRYLRQKDDGPRKAS